MTSMEELRVVRLYRAYNTVIQMCTDRGFSVRHPSAVAMALGDARLYSDAYGLDYDWFLRHFVVRATGESEAEGNASSHTPRHSLQSDSPHNNNNNNNNNRTSEGNKSGGQWMPMRHAMRLVCYPSHSSEKSSSPPAPSEGAETDGHSAISLKGDALLVFFAAPTLTTSELLECRTKAMQKGARAMMIVSAGRIAPLVRREAMELGGRLRPGTREKVLTIQLFEEDALACNIARHETVAPHVPLTVTEAQSFLRSRQLVLSQLPRILESDPMVAYLGVPRGGVVRIQRETKESGPYEMYRQVI